MTSRIRTFLPVVALLAVAITLIVIHRRGPNDFDDMTYFETARGFKNILSFRWDELPMDAVRQVPKYRYGLIVPFAIAQAALGLHNRLLLSGPTPPDCRSSLKHRFNAGVPRCAR